MSQTKIIKYDDWYSENEVASFDIGDEVEVEDYPPYKLDDTSVNYNVWTWPGTRRAIIVDTDDYDGDVDDYGRSYGIPAKAWVAIVPNNRDEPFVERFDIDQLFEKGTLNEPK